MLMHSCHFLHLQSVVDCFLTNQSLCLPLPFVALQVPQSLATSRSSLAFIPGSAKLLLFSSPCLQASALLLDISTGQPLREVVLPGCPSSIAVSPGGQLSCARLAFGLADGRVLLADAAGEASRELGACAAGRVPVASLVFTAGGQLLVAAAGNIVSVWDA
jgi:hypothetical protein